MKTSLSILALTTTVLLLVPMADSSEVNATNSVQKTNQIPLANYIELERINSQFKFFRIAARRVRDLWNYYVGKKQDQDTFIGRCFGIARKIKMAMPLIMVKLGVIVTVLVFLTIFSLKTLGLLATLLVLNISGAVSKLTLLFASKQENHHGWQQKPQTVHFHVHGDKTKESHPYTGYYDHEDWDRNAALDRELEKLELYNLYDKLRRNPYSRRNRGR